jgi:hypothetical protein
MKPAAALLFAAATTAMARGGGAPAAPASPFDGAFLPMITRDDMSRFVAQHIDALLRAPTPRTLALFAKAGLATHYQSLALVVARLDNIKVTRAEGTKTLIPFFRDVKNTKYALQTALSANAAVKVKIARILGADPTAPELNIEAIFAKIDWPAVHEEVALRLMADAEVTKTLTDTIRRILGAKTTDVHTIVSKPAVEALAALTAAGDDQMVEVAEALRELRAAMLTGVAPAVVLRMLQASGVSLAPLEDASAKLVAAFTKEAPVPQPLCAAIVQEVRRQHPKWATTGVVRDADSSVDLESAAASALLLRIYLRSTYVPHAGNALLKQRFRRRIGPVATQPHQQSLDVEVGFVEHYDIQQYKQYDWQGWYQRMVDIFHRNVSVRCRLQDLRRLDNAGRPFIDLQTERRLRVVAEDRVGRGMIKLDTDKFEDQPDNLAHGAAKLQELLSEGKKAQLGKEYWPTVEVKVRKPSGQSKMHYSVLDWDRVEDRSALMYKKYTELKKTQLFVPPTATWLTTAERATSVDAGAASDADGYTVGSLFESLDGGEGGEGAA